jgi:hypothetical protein
MHHLGEVVQSAVCAVRTYSVYEPETLFFINMTEERLQSCMCQVRGMMVTVLGMVTVCGLEEWSRCVLEDFPLRVAAPQDRWRIRIGDVGGRDTARV